MSNWWDHANCLGIDPDVFFPERENPITTELRVAAAKAICATCTVQTQCLQYALDRPERYGIWGHTTPTQRRLIRRDRRLTLKAAS